MMKLLAKLQVKTGKAMVKESYSVHDSHQQVKLNLVSRFIQYNKNKGRLVKLLVQGLRFCKKSDISIKNSII